MDKLISVLNLGDTSDRCIDNVCVYVYVYARDPS